MSEQTSKTGCFFPLGCLGILLIPAIIIYPLIFKPNENADFFDKARQTEAKQYLRWINRAQQTYFAQHKSFANSIEKLELKLKSQTLNYTYSIRTVQSAAFSVATSNQPYLKSYVSAIFLVPQTSADPKKAPADSLTQVTIICETNKPGRNPTLALPSYQNGRGICGEGTQEVPLNQESEQ